MNNVTDQSANTDVNWLSHVEAWRQSGKTMTQYCEQHGLALHQMGYYKRKYQSSPASGFARVSVKDAGVPDSLSIQLPGGVTVSVESPWKMGAYERSGFTEVFESIRPRHPILCLIN